MREVRCLRCLIIFQVKGNLLVIMGENCTQVYLIKEKEMCPECQRKEEVGVLIDHTKRLLF